MGAHPVRYAYNRKGAQKAENPSAEDLEVYLTQMFDQARLQGYTVMINFDPESSEEMEGIWTQKTIAKDLVQKLKLTSPNHLYYKFPVKDFQAPEDYIVDAFNEVVRSLPKGTKIIAHCGEGYGRTGTMLAALQLQTQFDILAKEPSTLVASWGDCRKDAIIPLGHFAFKKRYPGCAQALEAVTAIRAPEKSGKWGKDSDGDAVEVEAQAEFLNKRCVLLREEAKTIQDSQEEI